MNRTGSAKSPLMSNRIVIGVGIAGHPVSAAGNTWAFLQWVLGFRKIGWQVWVVESIEEAKCCDPDFKPCPYALSANRAHWEKTVREFGLEDCSTLLVDGEAAGFAQLMDFASGADLFLNISGHFKDRRVLEAVKSRIYLDLDPAFTQIWAEVYNVDMNFSGHDVFFSVGGLMNACRAPKCGREWKPTLPPVALEYWGSGEEPPSGAVFTTMTHWYGYSEAEYHGEWYGNKSTEFEKILDLPTRTRAGLEIATDLSLAEDNHRHFSAAGWRLVKASPLNEPWQRYREYIAGSRGEFCVAKNGYVRSRCGWFSDRSACYLAMGRPVVLQETGWSELLPAGPGLLPFHDTASAAAALEEVLHDEAAHRSAARRIAGEYLEAGRVAQALLGRL